MGRAARPRHWSGDPRPVGRAAARRNRLALPGAASPGKTGLAEGRVEAERSQSAGEVLPIDAGGQDAAPARAGPMVAAGARHRADHEPGGNPPVTPAISKE